MYLHMNSCIALTAVVRVSVMSPASTVLLQHCIVLHRVFCYDVASHGCTLAAQGGNLPYKHVEGQD